MTQMAIILKLSVTQNQPRLNVTTRLRAKNARTKTQYWHAQMVALRADRKGCTGHLRHYRRALLRWNNLEGPHERPYFTF